VGDQIDDLPFPVGKDRKDIPHVIHQGLPALHDAFFSPRPVPEMMPDVRCKQLGSLSPVTPVREIEMPSYDSAGVGCVVRGLSEQDARRLENWVDKNDCCDGWDGFH